MKHCAQALALLTAFLLACGGGSKATGPTTPEGPPAASGKETTTDSADPGTEPGMSDEDRIPPKPKPFISVSSLVGSNQAGAGAPVSSVPAVEAEKTIARVIEMFVALGDGMEKAGEDCDAVAASLRSWTKTYVPELLEMVTKLGAIEQQLTEERKQAIEKELAPVGEKVQASMQKCAQSEAVLAAVAELSAAFQPAAEHSETDDADEDAQD